MNIQSINEAITKAQKSNSKPYQIFSSNPIKANKGSIRKTLLDNKDLYGLKEVSQGANGVHLSAGAVEGLRWLESKAKVQRRKVGCWEG